MARLTLQHQVTKTGSRMTINPDVLDGRRPRPADLSLAGLEVAFRAAVNRTHEILRSMGLLAAVPDDQKQNMEHT